MSRDRKEYLKEYYKRNKEKYKAYSTSQWESIKSDPIAHAEYNQDRKNRKAGTRANRVNRERKVAELGGKCVVCGSTENLEINHRNLADTYDRRSGKSRCEVSLTKIKEGTLDVELMCRKHHHEWSCAQRKAAFHLFASQSLEEQIRLTRQMLPQED